MEKIPFFTRQGATKIEFLVKVTKLQFIEKSFNFWKPGESLNQNKGRDCSINNFKNSTQNSRKKKKKHQSTDLDGLGGVKP